MTKLIIGSRGSKLALWQANWVKSKLEKAHPGLTVEIEIIKTTGDKLTEASLVQIGGKGVFTKEIEDALIERRVDLAVHSLKDLPTALPEGLHITAITEREDVRDALIVSEALRENVKTIKDLPQGARVGTSSLRRRAQLLYQRPDLQIHELRGNVDTRLRKLDEGQYDAIILASAGLIRLGFSDRITVRIEIEEMLTAVGQGALGIETRIDDQQTNLLLEVLNHEPTRNATEAERALLRALGGGCAVPIAALGRIRKDRIDGKKTAKLILDALAADADGRKLIRRQSSGPIHHPAELGAQLAQILIAAGASKLLPAIGEESQSSAQSPQAEQADEASIELQPAEPGPVQISLLDSVTEVEVEEKNQQKLEQVDEPSIELQPAEALPAQVPAQSPQIEQSDEPSIELQPAEPLPAQNSVPVSVTEVNADELNQQSPLARRRIILTRSVKQSGELTEALKKLGAEVMACPTIEIKEPTSWDPLDRALKHLSWYDWLAFTSANGVEYFLRRLDELGHGRAELMMHKVCAVGRKTAEQLKGEKISVDLTPERFTAEALVEEFIRRYGVRQRLRGARMLLPASRTTRDVIRPALDKVGVYVEVIEAYQTVLPASSSAEVTKLIRNANADYIIFTSPSTVSNLATLLETDHLEPHLARTRVACIGPVTAEAARQHGLNVHIQPEEHTGEAIVAALIADRLRSGI